MRFILQQFNEHFPNDDACLRYMWESIYGGMKVCPKCGVADPSYYRVRSKKVFECKDCGNQISPLAHTIFHKSETSLRSWFFVIYMFSVSKNGVSAKEVERVIGCTYKTAWRMTTLVRSLMREGNFTLHGVTEADETYIGGRRRLAQKFDNKQIVFGVVERGGRVKAQPVKTAGARVLLPEIIKDVATGSHIYTDEHGSYRRLPLYGYTHTTVNHSKLEYVRGTAYTNTIEGFWSQLKRSIDGTYHAVSPKYLNLYVQEFVYRYNHRIEVVFPGLLARAARHV